jgi:heterotetrameric sarcosine oxidase delta subunit
MLLIACPYCGERAEVEFRWGGEGHFERPDPSVNDARWAEYLFFRKNIKGVDAERWQHVHGCRQWFNLLRDSATHEILAVYRMGEAPPELAPEAAPAKEAGS